MGHSFKAITAALVCACLFLSGCGYFIASRKQRVAFTTATPGARIILGEDTLGIGTGRKKLRKSAVYYCVTAQKDGYKPRSFAFNLEKPGTSLYVGAAIDVAAGVTGALISTSAKNDDGSGTTSAIVEGVFTLAFLGVDKFSSKTHRFKNKYTIPELMPYESREANEKYLLVNRTAIDVKKGDIKVVNYKTLEKERNRQLNGREKSGKKISRDRLNVEQTIFTYSLNKTLNKMNFIDTSRSVFTDVTNSMYIDATIKNIKFHMISGKYNNSGNGGGALLAVELSIEWNLLDYYKQNVATITTRETSDYYPLEAGSGNAEINTLVTTIIKDNLEYSLMAVRKDLRNRSLITINKAVGSTPTEAAIEIAPVATTAVKKPSECYSASVVIQNGKKNYSGVIISTDGYILTSYTSIANATKVAITFNDSSKADAEVVRKNADGNIALLKVNKTGLAPLALSSDAEPEIGNDAWIIGASGDTSSYTSLSKGIISGVRKKNGVTMLQTDASINASNSGGAVINGNGIILGIVTGKLSDLTEGIGFGITAADARRLLNIKYK